MFSLFKKSPKKRTYLDHAAATPIDEEVLETMHDASRMLWANASSLHSEGEITKTALQNSRIQIAKVLHCKADEIYFTSGGTEAANIAIDGVVMKAKAQIPNPHIIVSTIEHPAILEKIKAISKWGVEVSYISPDDDGLIRPESIERELRKETVLVILMHANNEIGTIQPVQKVAKILKSYKEKEGVEYPYFLVDASQSAAYEDISIERLGADLLIFDGIKIYGPRGAGALCMKSKVKIAPSIFGGGQEGGIRPGTENVIAAAGLAKALDIAAQKRESENERLNTLRNYCMELIEKEIPGATLNGSRIERLSNNINFCFPGTDSEFLVIKLDTLGFAVSAASACNTIALENSSYVIESLGKKECAGSSLRFTFGRDTNLSDINALIEALKKII